jgi:multiple sugar transport system permease protein
MDKNIKPGRIHSLQWQKSAITIGLYLIIALFLIWTLFPVFWIFLTSFKTTQQINAIPPLFIFKPTFDNYVQIFSGKVMTALRNSLIISSSTVILGIAIGLPAAYVLARARFKARGQVNFWILSMRMAPPFAFIVPYYLTFRFFGLLDKHMALIIINLTFCLPFAIWMLESVISDLPVEIEEAALIDGCSRLGVIRQIVLPLTAPSIAATAILTFIFSWNEFFFANILTGTTTQTMPVTLISFIGLMGVNWVQMSAAGIVAIVPTIILALLAQRFLVRGLTLGAVKS